MLAECGSCGTRYAPDLAVCPHCGSSKRKGEMAKIITGAGPSYPEGHAPGDGEEHVHPAEGGFLLPEDVRSQVLAYGEELARPLGTGSPVVVDGGAQAAPAEPPAAVPPRVPLPPPRRTPPPAVPGE